MIAARYMHVFRHLSTGATETSAVFAVHAALRVPNARRERPDHRLAPAERPKPAPLALVDGGRLRFWPMATLKGTAVGRQIEKVAGSPRFAKIGPKVVPKLDRFLFKVTRGRVLMSAGMVPSLMLNVRGAKTGQLRQTPLACVPDGEVWYIVGSNFGREKHPVWTTNLMKNPDASIGFRGKTYDVTASLLAEDEKAAVWPKLTEVWPNYDVYVERSKRDLRVFRLDRRLGR